MKKTRVVLQVAVLLVACVSAWAQVEPKESRTWTSVDDTHKADGTLIAVKDGWVKLQKSDDTTTTAQLSKLSQADRDFVAEWLEPKPGVIEGRVIRVVDGDTLHVLDANKQTHKIRLPGDRRSRGRRTI